MQPSLPGGLAGCWILFMIYKRLAGNNASAIPAGFFFLPSLFRDYFLINYSPQRALRTQRFREKRRLNNGCAFTLELQRCKNLVFLTARKSRALEPQSLRASEPKSFRKEKVSCSLLLMLSRSHALRALCIFIRYDSPDYSPRKSPKTISGPGGFDPAQRGRHLRISDRYGLRYGGLRFEHQSRQ